MKLFLLAAILLQGCSEVVAASTITMDAGTIDAGSDASITIYCKVDSDCQPDQTCVWQQIATYNPNVPGGFSGECEPRS